ncbi:MAG: DUF1934 domain-containing protein [Lachnospiraceae bacterium]
MEQKRVLIRIKGMQFAPESTEEDMIESMMMGVLYEDGEYSYIEYTEEIEEIEEEIKVVLKFKPGFLELQKSGPISVVMRFEKDTENQTTYATPMGDLILGIHGKSVDTSVTTEHIYVMARYSLDVNYAYLCDCHIEIKAEIK